MEKLVEKVRSWGSRKESAPDLSRSQYSLVSCAELTPGAVQLWQELPDEIKYDPALAQFRQLYEKEYGKEEPGKTSRPGRLPLVNSAPHLNNNLVPEDILFKLGVERKEHKPVDSSATEKHHEKKKKSRVKEAGHLIKMTALLACWVYFTVIFLIYSDKKVDNLSTYVNPGQAKYHRLINGTDQLLLSLKTTGPFLSDTAQETLNDTQLRSAKKLNVWLEARPENSSEASKLSKTWSIVLLSESNLDFNSGELRTNTLRLRSNDTTSTYFLALRTDSSETVPAKLSYTLNPLEVSTGVIYSCVLLCGLYVLIIFEVMNRTMAAVLISTTALATLAIAGERPSLAEVISWLDVETLLLLFSMMVLVAIMAETGMFDYLAVFTFERLLVRPTLEEVISWLDVETLLLLFSMMVLVAIMAETGMFDYLAVFTFEVISWLDVETLLLLFSMMVLVAIMAETGMFDYLAVFTFEVISWLDVETLLLLFSMMVLVAIMAETGMFDYLAVFTFERLLVRPTLEEVISWLDVETLLLLFSMMVLVAIMAETGMFDYLAVFTFERLLVRPTLEEVISWLDVETLLLLFSMMVLVAIMAETGMFDYLAVFTFERLLVRPTLEEVISWLDVETLLLLFSMMVLVAIMAETGMFDYLAVFTFERLLVRPTLEEVTMEAVLISTAALATLTITGERPTLEEVISWLDVETLLLLFSMMVLVAIMAETGMFDYLAVFTFERLLVRPTLEEVISWLDVETLLLLFSMMVLVAIMAETGMFDYLAVFTFERLLVRPTLEEVISWLDVETLLPLFSMMVLVAIMAETGMFDYLAVFTFERLLVRPTLEEVISWLDVETLLLLFSMMVLVAIMAETGMFDYLAVFTFERLLVRPTLEEVISWLDVETLLLLFSMMVLVAIMAETGMFDYLAVFTFERLLVRPTLEEVISWLDVETLLPLFSMMVLVAIMAETGMFDYLAVFTFERLLVRPTLEEVISWLDVETLLLLFSMMVLVAIMAETGMFDYLAVFTFEPLPHGKYKRLLVRSTLEEVISWLDVETLLLLFSMMVLVAIMAETGMFDYLAVFTFERTKGKLWPLITLLCVITAVLSTVLDNVTTVLLITPVTIRLCEVMDLDPIPILMSMVLFSNIGGTATPVGDPPNVIIASNKDVIHAGVNFTNFTLHMTVGILLVGIQSYAQLRFMFRDTNKMRICVPRDIQELRNQINIWKRAADSLPHLSKDVHFVRERLERKIHKLHAKLEIMEKESNKRACPKDTFLSTLAEMKEKYKIRDKKLLIKATLSISFVVMLFFLHSVPELNKVSLGWSALLGAILLLILADREDLEPILHRVEWSTLLFFAALFVLMEALSKLGLIEFIGGLTEALILQVDESARLAVAILLMLWVSGVTSAFVDNIPLTTMMVRVVTSLGSNPRLNLPMMPLIWALSFGACLGGNGTLIGASANVVCAGVAEQHGYKFTFMQFFKIGFPIMIGHLIVASAYLLICHCAFEWH
ncbi:citrate transporter domain-containing protein [Phthorimaea operculella]|nr:citrate transporter domain-containing protein [Phthorimaea operculella]